MRAKQKLEVEKLELDLKMKELETRKVAALFEYFDKLDRDDESQRSAVPKFAFETKPGKTLYVDSKEKPMEFEIPLKSQLEQIPNETDFSY